MSDASTIDKSPAEKAYGLRDELVSLINRYSRENESDTPDYILADFMISCLLAFETEVKRREKWYGRQPSMTGLKRSIAKKIEQEIDEAPEKE